MKENLKIKGMTCSVCKIHVEKALLELDGVKTASVNLGLNTANVEYDENIVNKFDMKSNLIKAGYDLELVVTEKKKLNKFIISIVLTAILMFITLSYMFGLTLISNPFVFTLVQAIITLVVMILNRDYFRNGLLSLVKFKANMNSLIAVGSTAAYLYGIYLAFLIYENMKLGNDDLVFHYTHSLYFETSAMIIVLVSIGKVLEEKAKNKTVSAINELISEAPKTALLLNGDIVDVDELKVDDVIVVKPGDLISADGVVVKGSSSVDEASVTGESQLKNVFVESIVYNGTKNIDGVLEIKVTKINKDSTLQKVLDLVLEASNSKAKISSLADKISLVFVPVVILISIITFIVWFSITKSFETSFSFMLSVLVISCPCALGLATPVAVMASIGLASKNSILIKSADYLEKCKNIDVVVFDKTGTITEGKPYLVDNIEISSDVKDILYTLENSSTHPLALAVLEFYKDAKVLDYSDFKNIPGYGISAFMNNKTYYFGSVKFLEESNVVVDEKNKLIIEKFLKSSNTVTVLFSDKLDAILTFNDKIKVEAEELVKRLNLQKIKTVMLTGDNYESAISIANKVGISEVKSNLLPNDKADYIKELVSNNLTVMMLGDGINDSLALINSSVGVAVSNASDLAIENANVVIKENKLLDVINIINISKLTFKIIKENLFWAFFYNIIGIPLAAGVLYSSYGLRLTPLVATICMSVSSVMVVLNALRINRIKIIKKEV